MTLQSGRSCLGLPAAARGAGPSVAAACGGRVSPGGAATPQDVGRGAAAPGTPGLGSENRSRDELLLRSAACKFRAFSRIVSLGRRVRGRGARAVCGSRAAEPRRVPGAVPSRPYSARHRRIGPRGLCVFLLSRCWRREIPLSFLPQGSPGTLSSTPLGRALLSLCCSETPVFFLFGRLLPPRGSSCHCHYRVTFACCLGLSLADPSCGG